MTKSNTKSYLHLISILIICLVSIYLLRHLLFETWTPQTIDGEMHLVRFRQYYLALSQGQFPPTWAPNLVSGLGYPVFQFNYALPNIHASLWMFLGFSAANSLKLMNLVYFITAGLGVYFFLPKASVWAKLVGALVYISSPYMLLNVFERGSIGETTAMAILPWVLLLTKRYLEKTNLNRGLVLTLVLSLFFLSHNISVLIGSILIFFYVIWTKPRLWYQMIWPTVLAFTMVTWFWIPALWDISSTSLSKASLNTDYFRFFKTLGKLTNIPPKTDYYLNITNNEPIPQQLGYAPMLIILVILVTFLLKSKKLLNKELSFFIGVSLIAVFMTHRYSLILWQLIPPLRYTQFPFRFIQYFVFSTSLVSIYLVKKYPAWGLAFLSAAGINLLFSYKPMYYLPYEDGLLEIYQLTTTAEDEIDPPWFDKQNWFLNFPENQPIVALEASESAQINIQNINGTAKSYLVSTTKPTTIIERTMYFPGWETRVNGQLIDLDKTKYNQSGLINFALVPGEYQIETRFTQNTPVKKISNSLSVVGWVVFVILTLRNDIHVKT